MCATLTRSQSCSNLFPIHYISFICTLKCQLERDMECHVLVGDRNVFSTQPNIYDGEFFRKQITALSSYTLFFIRNTFINNARWKWEKIKQILSNTPRLNFCYLKMIHLVHSSSTLSSKNNRIYSKKLAKEQAGLCS